MAALSCTVKHDKLTCTLCSARFTSRNALFKHLKDCSLINNKSTFLMENLGKINFLKVPVNNAAYLFIGGGRLRGKTLASVEKLNLKSMEWTQCPPMQENRGSHSYCSVDRKLHSFGGGGLKSNLSTCECYHYESNQWSYINPMPSSRHALSTVSNQLNIFAVGGWIDGSTCSSAVECYNLLEGSWNAHAPLLKARRLFGLASFDENLFVFGGQCDDPEWYTETAERYDPVGFDYLFRGLKFNKLSLSLNF